MSWMAALDIRAGSRVFIVVVLRIGLQLRGHNDEIKSRVLQVGGSESMVRMGKSD